MGETSSVRQINLLDQQTLGDNLILRGRSDKEFRRGFVVRMVDHRQPLTGAIRPVLAERGSFAVNVRDQAKSFRGHAPILNREGDFLSGLESCGQGKPK